MKRSSKVGLFVRYYIGLFLFVFAAIFSVSSKKPMIRIFTSQLNSNFHLAIDNGKVVGHVSDNRLMLLICIVIVIKKLFSSVV